MHRLTLPGTTITTSALGFGTAQLMARLGRRESVRLLNAAFDAGITHIDTARLYGYGEAERAVGDLLEGRRDRITVATKFGIFPPKRSPLLQTAKAMARAAARLNPRWRERLRARAGGLVKHGHFTVADAMRSLETSLRELRTDYVDLLLLHECRIGDLEHADELRERLDRLVAEGRVRAYGIATDVETVEAAVHRFPALARVALFPSDARNRNLQRVRPGERALITHSPFGNLLRAAAAYLDARPEAARRWSEALGDDCRNPTVLATRLLEAAHTANPAGIVVFASTDAARIRANAEVAARTATQDGRARVGRFDLVTRLLQEIPDEN
jgi:D-threo-aldose 1-dehydrogenase